MDIAALLFTVLFAVSTVIVARVAISMLKRWREEEQRKDEKERRKAEDEQNRRAEQERERVEKEERERLEEEQRQHKEEQQRKAEEERKRLEDEAKQKAQEARAKERRQPSKRGGRPRGSTKQGTVEQRAESKPLSPKPEIVCWKEGWNWLIGIEVLEELKNSNVTQNGEHLERDNTDESRYLLRRADGAVKVTWDGGEKDISLVGEGRNYLIFKMRKNWKEPGRLVRCSTTGYYLIVVPQEWERDQEASGSAPVALEGVQLDGYKAHFFYQDLNGSRAIGFITANDERTQVELRRPSFQLVGSEIGDASEEMGLLFGGEPPLIRALDGKRWTDVGMIVAGEEGSGKNRWRTQFVPQVGAKEQKLPEEIVTRRGGWYFVRIYDKDDDLLESMDFRFITGLKAIHMERYDCLPGPKGYDNVTVQFLHQTGCQVELMDEDKQHALKISRESDKTIVAVPPKTDCDKTHWILRDGDAEIKVVLLVERIWWNLGMLGVTPTDWVDKPITLSCKDFTAITDKVLWVRLPRLRFVRKIDVGFDPTKSRVYQVEVEKKELAVPLRDFCDAEEIQNPMQECLFYLFIDSQDKTYSAPLLQIRISFRCKKCEFITSSEQEALSHIVVHLSDLIPHLSYEELYQRSRRSLPPKIYRCSYCNFYVPADNPESPTSTICLHIERNCQKTVRKFGTVKISFSIVSDIDEIRDNVIENLPHIYRCQICSKEFQGDDRELRLNHLQEDHKNELFEIL